MTDKELIALVESKLPQELSLDEIDLLRRRMRASPTVRRALASQVELDQYLASLIGSADLSPEKIAARAARAKVLGRGGLWSWLGWTACVLMLGFVTALSVWAFFIRPGDKGAAQNLAKNGNDAAAAADPNRAAAAADSNSAKAKLDEAQGVLAKSRNDSATNDRRNMTQNLPPNPTAIVAGRKRAPGRIEIAAIAVSRQEHLKIDQTEYGRGIGVLVGGDHGKAEFDFLAPAGGDYRLDLRYAAEESRPLKLSLNGKVIKERAAAEVTGDWYPPGQRVFSEGVFELRKGLNTLRLESAGFFPHLSLIAFEPAVGEPNVAAAPAGPPPQPWLTKDNLDGPARPIDEIAFDQFDSLESPPSQDTARRWFTPLDGGRVEVRDHQAGRMPSLEGRLRLNAPLSEDSVLRLSFYESQMFSLHFWRGNSGLTLRNYDYKGSLVAFAVTGPDKNRPIRALAATDDDRNWRTNQPLWPLRMDIRFHKGMMVVSRGDNELLRAPFDGLPQEVVFDGHALVRGLALVRTSSEPAADPAPRPNVEDISRPADQKWESQVPQGMSIVKGDDGSVELKSKQSQQPGWMAVALPGEGLGLHELIVELDDVTPGSNIGLGSIQNDPKPKASIGFFRENNTGGLSFRWNGYGDNSMDYGVDFNNGAGVTYAARHMWIKFVGGCGLKCYTSLDGRHWARMLQALETPPYPLTHLTLWCPPSGQPRGIRVRRVTMRKLEAVESLGPGAEIMAKAPALPIPDSASWLAEVNKRKPDQVGRDAWRRACALKTLAMGGSVPQMRGVVGLLADAAVALPSSPQEQFKRLDELALLTNVYADSLEAGNFMSRYAEIAERLHRAGESHPWSSVAPAIARSPLWCLQQYSIGVDRMLRAELLDSVYAGKPHDVEKLLARLRLANAQDPLVLWASDWAARHGENEPALPRDAQRVDRRHPFIEELNKEGFNLLGDFEAAMASKAYRDACQIIAGSDASETLGLWPDAQDPQLLVSINGAIDLAMAHDQQLRATMIREFGAIGALQLRQAMNDGDGAAVASVASRYRGTDAAAQAYLWLGDRAISTGDFTRARGYYARVAKTAMPQVAELLGPRDRLAAAMLGSDTGEPAKGPVRLGEVQLSASDFENLVAEMRRTHQLAGGLGAAADIAPSQSVPEPSSFELREIGRIDGELGDNPGDFGAIAPSRDQNTVFFASHRDRARFVVPDLAGAPVARGIDWAGRQLAEAVDGEMAYVSNRFEVAAFNLKEGKRAWLTGVGGEHARTHDWTLTPMRPTVVGKRIFVRRLVKTNPELAALEKSDGHLLWSTRKGLFVVSDPLWVDHNLIALTLSYSGGGGILYLSTFDPMSGDITAQERLATLRENWWQQRTCQLATLKDTLVAVFGGTVLCCDRSGKTLWVRRQEWIPPQDDRDWARQYQAPPIVRQDRLIVSQPGVAAVECLDSESGELVWRRVLPNLKRLTGLVDDRLIVETQSGFTAVAPDKGDALWFHDVGDVLDGQICGGAGKLLFSCREKVPGSDNQLRPVLVWLDPATGLERAAFAIDSLKHDHPMFGPFIAAGERIWAFAAGGENEPVRVLYEMKPNGQPMMSALHPRRAPIATIPPKIAAAKLTR
jgi:outer membrane protein assembly factor BamB